MIVLTFLGWHNIKHMTYSVLYDDDLRCLLSESSRALLVSSPGLPTCPDCAWYGLGWMVRGCMIYFTVLESFKIVLDCG